MSQQLLDKQLDFQKKIKQPWKFITPRERLRAINLMLRRAGDELNEAIVATPHDLTGYSKGKKLVIPIDEIVEEIADAQLFMANALNSLGVTWDEFLVICYNKQLENIKRFDSKKRFREKNDDHIIVIEGPDGVGKTAICKMLSEMTGYPTYRMPDGDNQNEKSAQLYRRTIVEVNEPMILDRFFPSSMIYGRYFKRDVPLDDLIQLTKKRDIFIFIIDRDEPFRGDDFLNEEQWPEIRDLYLSHAKANKWKIIKNDSTLENCVEGIIRELQF